MLYGLQFSQDEGELHPGLWEEFVEAAPGDAEGKVGLFLMGAI